MSKRWMPTAVLLIGSTAMGQDFKLGTRVSDFPVQSLNGNATTFSQLKGDVTVVVFISTQCPVSNAYNDRMNSVYSDYTSKGVHFVFLNANSSEPANVVAEHARAHGFTFTVYKDANNVVADHFNAQATPETYVIDRTGTLVYHGSIDDSQDPSHIHHQWLRAALDEVLAGQSVEKPESKAFGCTIKRVRKSF